MNAKPLVSVVMPNYNGEQFIAEAITSVLNQSYTNWELLITDDCSEDSSWKIISEFADAHDRIRAFQNDHNLGSCRARLRAIEEARGEYYAVLDSDDMYLEDKLRLQVRFLTDHPECGVVGCDAIIIDEHGERIGMRNYPRSHGEIVASSIRKNPFANSATMTRMALIKKHKYDLSLAASEDYDLWLRILPETRGCNLPMYLLRYRKYKGQVTSDVKKILRTTITIQLQNLFLKKYFSLSGMAWVFLEVLLLLLPAPVIIALFKKFEYRKVPG